MAKKLLNHTKCINNKYPGSDLLRFSLKEFEISWNYEFTAYSPLEYNAKSLENKPWADPPLESFHPKWNQMDDKINRKSHHGNYQIALQRPLNPIGRTGLTGRGLLGRWGPNHAADAIVTRWHPENRRILQFCAIQRHDCGEWAIPGGMVDPGERIAATLRREFREEALNTSHVDQHKKMDKFFENGTEIYAGYVDDPRNTDNAWMETVAVNFHDETGDLMREIHFRAGDDAKNVKWLDVTRDLQLYASHKSFIESVIELRNAFY